MSASMIFLIERCRAMLVLQRWYEPDKRFFYGVMSQLSGCTEACSHQQSIRAREENSLLLPFARMPK
ncbi:MAG: hypothetical protein C9356_04040 [Oleiphilus sp.]|nr:MAG: hypothetical protein C9356_04040 [Oleiphilus sp.]